MDTNSVRNIGVAVLILAGFAVVGTGLVALTYAVTKDIIAAGEREALMAQINALVPPERYDNSPVQDSIEVVDPQYLGTAEPVTFYRAYKNGQPVAVIATPIAPNGYSGPIKLLVAVYADGTVAGVRVLAHKETPGLGDGIEIARSNWILSFTGKSLGNPELKGWTVKKDGGAFDQFTGATITPYAVVTAVRKHLIYVQNHRDALFNAKRVAGQEKSP